MANYAMLCPDAAGHLYPIGSLGNELARRGHKVTLLGPSRSAPVAEQLSLRFHELDLHKAHVPSLPLLWALFSLFGAGWMIGLRTWYCRLAEGTCRLLPDALEDLAIDGLVLDQNMAAGGTVAEHLNLPFITVSSALPWNVDANLPPLFTGWSYATGETARFRNRLGYASWQWFMQGTLRIINHYRQAWKLKPFRTIDDADSPLALLCQLCPEMDFPRHKLPSTFHYVGPLGANRLSDTIDFPWHRLDGRPIIFASLGTVAESINLPVYRKILAACADLDAQLVLAMGRWAEGQRSFGEQLGKIPNNAIIVNFAPQLQLLEKASLLITHAGLNTVMEALSRGIPMVLLPRNADQPAVAKRAIYAGVGLSAPFRGSDVSELKQKVERVLTWSAFRNRAIQLQAAIRRAGGVQRAADIAEQALATGRPIIASL